MHRHELVGQQGEGREEDDGVFHAVGEDIAVAVHVEVPQQDGSGRDEQHKQETAQVRGVGKVLHVAAAAVEELEQQRLHGQKEHQEQGRPLGQLAEDERGRGLLVQLVSLVEARHPVVRVGRDTARYRVDGQVQVEPLFFVGRAVRRRTLTSVCVSSWTAVRVRHESKSKRGRVTRFSSSPRSS